MFLLSKLGDMFSINKFFIRPINRFCSENYKFNCFEWVTYITVSYICWLIFYALPYYIVSRVSRFGEFYYVDKDEIHLSVPIKKFKYFKKMRSGEKTEHLLKELRVQYPDRVFCIKTHNRMFNKETFIKYGIDAEDINTLIENEILPIRRQQYLQYHFQYHLVFYFYKREFFDRFRSWKEWNITINTKLIKQII